MLVAFSITPLGTGEGVGEIVAEAVRVVRESGLPNRTGTMLTNIVKQRTVSTERHRRTAQDTYRRSSVHDRYAVLGRSVRYRTRRAVPVLDAVAAAVKIVRDSGLPHRTSAMFTELEGTTWDECFDVVKRATEAVLSRSGRGSLWC